MAKKPKKWIPALISCTLIVVICAVTGVSYIRERYRPSDERVDLNAMYQVTAEGQVAILKNNLLTQKQGVLRDGEVYLPYSYVAEAVNKRVYVDENEELLIYTLPDQVVDIPAGTALSQMSQWKGTAGKEGLVWYQETVGEDTVTYISVTCLSHLTDLEFSVYTQPYRLYLDDTSGLRQTAVVTKDTEIRQLGGIKSPIVADVDEGSQVTILDAMETWSQVRTEDGWTGYLLNKYLDDYNTYEVVSQFETPVYTDQLREYEICLVWHQVKDQGDNAELSSVLKNTRGVNTISPTWFALSDDEGNFTSLASTSYVEEAHQMGLEVWGLVDNFSPDMSTYTLLSHTSTRRNLIQNLLQAALEYDLDGINIDFEGMAEATGPHFVQFIRELSVVCREHELVLSTDMPALGRNWYGRAEQAEVADYIIIMGYDEHWAKSDAGSTASLPFVKNSIERTLKEVPQEKVICGLPFYTRVWGFDANAMIPEGADPNAAEYVISNVAKGMGTSKRLLEEHGAELVWDDEIGQYYGEYEEDGTIYRIWLEDATSLQTKLDAVAQYDLSGIAFWKLGLESDDAWDVVAEYMNR